MSPVPFEIERIYTRKQIGDVLGIQAGSLETGVFHPKGSNLVLLFVTEKKDRSQTQYKDRLLGEILEWDGQNKGGTDDLIINGARNGLHLLLFFRKSKRQYPDYGFAYLGTVTHVAHSGSNPTHFRLLVNEFDGTTDSPASQAIYEEGERFVGECSRYQRDPVARSEAIGIRGPTCEVCGFDFERTYGLRGEGFAEVHHVVPLSETRTRRMTNPATDLVILCSNCHRMIHRVRSNVLTPEQLRELITRSDH